VGMGLMLKFKLAMVVAIGTLVALAGGCGGGGSSGGVATGGNGGSYPYPSGGSSIVLGKVVDMSGNAVPGASVSADTGQTAATLSQGGFRLDGVPAGVRRIRVSVQQNGTTYTGSTQVLSQSASPPLTVSNANVQVSPTNQQASVTGTVRDPNGQPLAGARVFLGVFVSPGTAANNGADGGVASLVAFADANGVYRLDNVPAPSGQSSYAATASLLSYQNTRANIDNLRNGETRTQDFTLGGASTQAGPTPTNVAAFTFTQPGNIAQAHAVSLAASASALSAYEQIRRAMSPAYARRAPQAHASAQAHSKAHASPFGAYAIEADVFFDNTQPDNVSGFRVYNSVGNAQLTPYDFLQDPLANVYTDLDPTYVPNQQYSFAVSAVTTTNSESGVSPASTVVPLDGQTLVGPQNGQTVQNPVSIAWNRVNGADTYSVFVYPQFPSVGVAGTQQDAAAGASSLALPSLASGDYYYVVAGARGDGSAVTVSPITRFHVP